MTDQIAQTFDSPGTVPTGSTEQWRDKKRFLWLIGLVVPSLAFVGYGLWAATGFGGCLWIGPVVILVSSRPSTCSPGSTARTRPTT